VIYAAIVVMWAVVLVPMWIHRHDAATESRSVERFSAAMRSLARKRPVRLHGRAIVMPRRLPDSMSWHVSGPAVRAKAARPAKPAAAKRPAVASRAQLIARRRRTLLVLVGLVLLSALLALVGAASWLLQLTFDVLAVGYGAYLRRQAKVASVVRRKPVRAPAGVRAGGQSRNPAVNPRSSWLPAEAAEVAEAAEPAAAAMAAGGESWHPVPVPPPSYLTRSRLGSPAAPQPMVDLTRAGSNLLDELGLFDDIAEDDTQEFAIFAEADEPLERRRAVND
jgi:hypothetical protein